MGVQINGSTGNVIVYQYYYETAGRKGIATSLTAVQVTDLQEFTGAVDFEPIVPVAQTTEPSSNEMPF